MDWGRVEKARLVIVRGLPGSGKTTLAAELKAIGFVHFENDMWFEREGGYQYDPSEVEAGQRWCYESSRDALLAGRGVVVSNVFCKVEHMAGFLELDGDALVIEMTGSFGTVHEIPEAKIVQMKANWDIYEPAIRL